MYANGDEPLRGDIVRGDSDEGEVIEVTERGPGGEQYVTVRWTTPHEKAPGIYAPRAPQSLPTRSLTLVRRKTA
jgi:hypothetical protein